MPEYLAPGVYVEEVDTGSKPIEGVSTSTAGMVGVTERGPVERADPRHQLRRVPPLVRRAAERRPIFATTAYLPHAVEGFFTNGGQAALRRPRVAGRVGYRPTTLLSAACRRHRSSPTAAARRAIRSDAARGCGPRPIGDRGCQHLDSHWQRCRSAECRRPVPATPPRRGLRVARLPLAAPCHGSEPLARRCGATSRPRPPTALGGRRRARRDHPSLRVRQRHGRRPPF